MVKRRSSGVLTPYVEQRFQVFQMLGSGSYGKVYKVKRRSDNLICVMKRIDLENESEAILRETMNEVELLKKISHPNVVKYLGSFHHESSFYIIMEYAEGGDLGQAIHTVSSHSPKRGFKESVLWKVARQLMEGLECLHDGRVIHRDVKPQNIFLDKDGNVKIGDFGLGRVLSARSLFAETTNLGTPLYMSPELCQEKPYNEKTDIWACGCVLYEMAMLSPPFVATNVVALYKKIVEDEPRPIRGYSSELSRLILAMLRKNPAARPSASDVLQDPYMARSNPRGGTRVEGSLAAEEEIHSLRQRIDRLQVTESRVSRLWARFGYMLEDASALHGDPIDKIGVLLTQLESGHSSSKTEPPSPPRVSVGLQAAVEPDQCDVAAQTTSKQTRDALAQVSVEQQVAHAATQVSISTEVVHVRSSVGELSRGTPFKVDLEGDFPLFSPVTPAPGPTRPGVPGGRASEHEPRTEGLNVSASMSVRSPGTRSQPSLPLPSPSQASARPPSLPPQSHSPLPLSSPSQLETLPPSLPSPLPMRRSVSKDDTSESAHMSTPAGSSTPVHTAATENFSPAIHHHRIAHITDGSPAPPTRVSASGTQPPDDPLKYEFRRARETLLASISSPNASRLFRDEHGGFGAAKPAKVSLSTGEDFSTPSSRHGTHPYRPSGEIARDPLPSAQLTPRVVSGDFYEMHLSARDDLTPHDDVVAHNDLIGDVASREARNHLSDDGIPSSSERDPTREPGRSDLLSPADKPRDEDTRITPDRVGKLESSGHPNPAGATPALPRSTEFTTMSTARDDGVDDWDPQDDWSDEAPLSPTFEADSPLRGGARRTQMTNSRPSLTSHPHSLARSEDHWQGLPSPHASVDTLLSREGRSHVPLSPALAAASTSPSTPGAVHYGRNDTDDDRDDGAFGGSDGDDDTVLLHDHHGSPPRKASAAATYASRPCTLQGLTDDSVLFFWRGISSVAVATPATHPASPWPCSPVVALKNAPLESPPSPTPVSVQEVVFTFRDPSEDTCVGRTILFQLPVSEAPTLRTVYLERDGGARREVIPLLGETLPENLRVSSCPEPDSSSGGCEACGGGVWYGLAVMPSWQESPPLNQEVTARLVFLPSARLLSVVVLPRPLPYCRVLRTTKERLDEVASQHDPQTPFSRPTPQVLPAMPISAQSAAADVICPERPSATPRRSRLGPPLRVPVSAQHLTDSDTSDEESSSSERGAAGRSVPRGGPLSPSSGSTSAPYTLPRATVNRTSAAQHRGRDGASPSSHAVRAVSRPETSHTHVSLADARVAQQSSPQSRRRTFADTDPALDSGCSVPRTPPSRPLGRWTPAKAGAVRDPEAIPRTTAADSHAPPEMPSHAIRPPTAAGTPTSAAHQFAAPRSSPAFFGSVANTPPERQTLNEGQLQLLLEKVAKYRLQQSPQPQAHPVPYPQDTNPHTNRGHSSGTSFAYSLDTLAPERSEGTSYTVPRHADPPRAEEDGIAVPGLRPSQGYVNYDPLPRSKGENHDLVVTSDPLTSLEFKQQNPHESLVTPAPWPARRLVFD
eukprot:Rmarinus@m.16467